MTKQEALKQIDELKKYVEELDKKWPESWEELGDIEGYYVNTYSRVNCCSFSTKLQYSTSLGDKNTFATEEQAKASIALAQISQLLKAYNGDWEPDWECDEPKYVIYYHKDTPEIHELSFSRVFIAFDTQEKAKHFLKHHRELIEQAKPLL